MITATKEKPIIFTGESVVAILDGRKTQTRRVIKPQPTIGTDGESWWIKDEWFVDDESLKDHLFHNVYGGGQGTLGAVYSDGTADRLWVRERFSYCPVDFKDTNGIIYKADNKYNDYVASHEWVSPLFMRKINSRITLEITDVRVERVTDISELDCEVELGVKPYSLGNDAYKQFAELWDSLNAKRGYPWKDSPFVWVYEFKRVRDEN